ncbi:MAG: tRNA uridine-5-carboxymethylaminomethyl(34) synthesis GTPase MnmE [Verrucomicrobiota bacterium]|nr:tRNA uridine-5-carboxymethylaminomethyl(34) synthesis GTPase MnmE [Verrucomicrobiota bacterium]
MQFVHRPYQKGDTIAAVATPAGEGAIAVLRISGSKAFEVAEAIFSKPIREVRTHTAHYGNILSSGGEIIDSVLLLVMRGPRSYTGEDTVEISCHGGSLVTRRVLERVIKAGARPAQPGEFSLQAFLNGKLDLAQAEAVQQLIAAKSELALQSAEGQLAGALSKKVSGFQKELTDVAAILEAWVDFPEEGLEFAAFDELIERLGDVEARLQRLADTFHEGKLLHEGLTLCLLGSPNVGKSSLMNALLGKERAIVTDIAGTTRDVLEEEMRLSGLHFRLMDTAGIRETSEVVEREGIRRSHAAMQEADLILLLLDASRPLDANDRELLARVPREKTILVWNKIDLANPSETVSWEPQVCISAREKKGLEALRAAIDGVIWKKGPPSKEEVAITKIRHRNALQSAIASVQNVRQGLKKRVSAEFVASDMRAALNELGTIIGTNVTEDILSSIFSQFCLGK